MNYLAVSGIVAFISSIICSVFVILSTPRDVLKTTWSLFSFSVSLWGIGLYQAFIAINKSSALFWSRFLNLSAITIPIFFFHFVLLLTGQFHRKKNELYCFYFIVFIYFLSAVVFPDLFVRDVIPKLDFLYYPEPGFLYYIFPLLFGCLAYYGVLLLLIDYKNTSFLKKNQFKYVILGVIVGFLGGGTTFFLVFNLKIYPFGAILVPFYVLMVTYAIIKHKLMDIKIIITRAGIFIVVYTLVLGLPFGLGLKFLGKGLWLAPVSLMAVLATVGPFLYLFMQRKAEGRLLQEQRQYQLTLQQASMGMGQIKDLGRLLKLIVYIVTRAVGIEHSEIYLLHEDSKKFILKASRGWRAQGKEQVSILPPDSLLVHHLKEIKESIVYDEISQYAKDHESESLKSIKGIIQQLDGNVVVPSFMDQKLIAVLVLGNKRSGKIYTQDDLAVFSILANQSALAIENAQFYEKMKETHNQLLKAEKMATVGTMADGLSHQINNRLHAMGFIAGDVLDTIKLKKKDDLTDDTRELLDEIEHSLSRIEDNVRRGGEIVEGLLKYTRKGSDAFEAIGIDALLEAALEMAQFKIKLNQMTIVRNFEATVPGIKGNFTQLQEVFFNLIDNAYDAMMQRKTELKEEGFKPQLEISVHPKGHKLEIVFRDNGMGVKKEDIEKLFTPFFTTKLSSKKGTGLGLYVIRQIVEENHRGVVEFISEYGKGSQTRLVLPMA